MWDGASDEGRVPHTNALIAASTNTRTKRSFGTSHTINARDTVPPFRPKVSKDVFETCYAEEQVASARSSKTRQKFEDRTAFLTIPSLAESSTDSLGLVIWQDAAKMQAETITNATGGAWYL